MIYTTFKQWVKGRFLETGEPRREAYSQAELDLVEMGWNYGFDAGVQWQKSQQALDKKAENARELGLDYEPEPAAWKETDEVKCPVCNDKGFPWPKCGHITYLERTPPKREWQGLTDEEVVALKMVGRDLEFVSMTALRRFARDIEATLKEKNT